ncbi:MAG: sterol desaturase family protein [Pseudomonadota bacterium]
MTTLSTLAGLYASVFPADLLRYLIGAGGTYLVVNVLLARRLARQTLRPGAVPAGQVRRELLASLRTVLIFTAAGTLIALGERAGVITVYTDIDTFGWAYGCVSVTVLIVLHDAWFYWTHRLLHHRTLFRRCHRLHHRSHRPTPFAAYSFDTEEAVVNAVYLPLVLLFLPTHSLALLVFVSHMMVRNAIGHCGVEVFPARADGRPLFSWLTTVTHHDLHHAEGRCNYGLYFTWWDRLMGTEHPRYLAEFARVAPRRRRRGITPLLMAVTLVSVFTATRGDASGLSGDYASPGLGVIVRLAPCTSGPSATCGTVLWQWDPAATPHVAVGDAILTDLVRDGSGWRGRLRDPRSGRTYHGTVHQPAPDRLLLRGCALVFCKQQTWHSTESLMQVLARLST